MGEEEENNFFVSPSSSRFFPELKFNAKVSQLSRNSHSPSHSSRLEDRPKARPNPTTFFQN